MNNIYKYGNVRQCCKKQISLIYIYCAFLGKSNINKSILQPAHSIQSLVLRCTLTCEDLWSPKICLFPLQTSTPHELPAVADNHNEHSQNPHVQHMSTLLPAEIQCYITQHYHYTLEGSSLRETRCYFCTLPKLSVISWPRPTNLTS